MRGSEFEYWRDVGGEMVPARCVYEHKHSHRVFVAKLKFNNSYIIRWGVAHFNFADVVLHVRKKRFLYCFVCGALRAVSLFSEACMVSGLAAIKQWRDGEGALLLSDGLRQTVTQQPWDRLLLTACGTITNRAKSYYFATLFWLCVDKRSGGKKRQCSLTKIFLILSLRQQRRFSF